MKINRLFKYFGLSCVLLTAACESTLEVEPEFVKDGGFIFKTIADYDFNLTGTYALLRQTGYFGSGGQTTSSWGMLPDMMTDNLIRTTEDLSNWLTQVNWGYTTAESDVEIAWIAAYGVISQANLTLRDIDQFAATDAKAVNRIKGQALAIRGMAHFDLLRYWGESYDRNSTAWGVPYKETVDHEEMPARLTVQQTYDKIFADMELAETLLGDVDKTINGSVRAYIDQLTVRALLARMHLYAKNYTQAESYATLAITARPLASRTAFPDIWKDASQSEVIWAVVFNSGEGSPSAGAHLASTNRNRFRPATTLEALYGSTPAEQALDVRHSSYFTTRNSNGGTPRRIINKFYGRGSFADNIVNWKALRTGEMYLIRAEARARLNNVAGGEQDINTLRAQRITGYVNATFLDATSLLDAIAIERRKELVGEGHRWFDLKRTALGVTRPAADCPSALICSLAPTAKEWTWPVPQVEIDANASISGQQTTGY